MQEQQKHILFIASWYPGRNAPALGNFIQQHAHAAALKNKVSVIYASADKNRVEGTNEIEQTHSGNLSEFRIYYGKINSTIPLLSKLKKREVYRESIKKGIEIAMQKNGKADLLHLHVIWPAAVALLPLIETLNLPLVITEHWSGYLPEDGAYKGLIQKNISKRITEKAKIITVVSQKMAEAMKKHGLGESFTILPNCVNTEIFKYQKRKEETKGVKLLHVSMLVDREKNISGLLRMMKSIESKSNITLEIIGEGPERNNFEEIATSLGLLNKSIFFRGFGNPETIASAMQNADALIMFSHFEGMPVTIIEAQCCGLPVLATRVGYIPQMVNDHQGILVEAGNEIELKNAVLKFCEIKSSFNHQQISKIANDIYSIEAVGNELNRIYSSVVG